MVSEHIPFNGIISEYYEDICNENKSKQKPRRKGHPISIETREKIANSHRGITFSEEHKRKIGLGVKRHYQLLNK